MENRKVFEEAYIAVQMQLKGKIDLQHVIQQSEIQSLAGVDLAYWKKGEEEYAVCCIVVMDYLTKKVLEKAYCVDKIDVPYIPGCLAFREIPLFLKTKEFLSSDPDLYVFDGNGYLHPRHMGIATHAGILIQKPTIGIAKTYYRVEDTEYTIPENKPFAFEEIVISDQEYGRLFRTHPNVKPIFLSIENQIDLDTATQIVKDMTTKESHIPLPTRLADLMTHEIRKQYTAKEQDK